MRHPIFLSYRRNDQPGYVARLADDLTSAFGDVVFRDVESILAGDDWQQVLKRTVSQAEVVIAVIGPQWASTLAERRTTSETDYVRLELNTAKDLGLPVIPVILEGAQMPDKDTLDELDWLVAKQGHRLSDTQKRWSFDIDRLADQIVELTSLEKKRKAIKLLAPLAIAGSIAMAVLIVWFISTRSSKPIVPVLQPPITINQTQSGDNATQIGTNPGTLIINNTENNTENPVPETDASQ